MADHEHTRKTFEDAVFNRRFRASIGRNPNPPKGFGGLDFISTGCPTQAELCKRDAAGDYEDETVSAMWWGWKAALTHGVMVDTATALPVLPVDDQPRPEEPLSPSWEGFKRPRPKLLRLCTINWSSSGWPDEGRGVWRIEGFTELGERTERFTLHRIAPALPGGPSGERISFWRGSYESGGLTIWRKGSELADPAYGVRASDGEVSR